MGIFGKKRTTVGLDIGRGMIKLVELDHGGDRPALRRAIAGPVPAESVIDGEIVRKGQVADAIRALFSEAGLQAATVATALGGHSVFVKTVETTASSASEATREVRRTAAEHIPFSLDGVHLDVQALRPSAGDGPAEVLLVAAKKENVAARVALIEECGAGVSLLDSEALALCNALEHNYPGVRDGSVALVNVGYEITSIIVLVDGRPLLIRDLPLGLRGFRELLERVYGLPPRWADEVILNRRELQGLDRALETGADVVAVEIERARAVVGTRRPGGGVGRVYLSGGGGCMPGVAGFLGRRLKMETHIVNPCARIDVPSGGGGRNDLAQAAPLFFQAVGLALRTPV